MRTAPTSRVPYVDLPHHAEWGLARTPDGSHGGKWYLVMRINCKSKLTWLVRDGPERGLDSQQTGLSGAAYGILATMRSGFFEIQIK
ncbi:hypothetical protein FOQG_17132 [Fusarium oxysporum f. sp. raphani 54005]|uniref:Uncharacterized protein n=2 Tax=Fusarium oxysporum TaxID=5507 RepID=X0C643_FUSOX|nr:hypothetical protein FOQG_17132 [Fusarium oxysporum f. sp. raphani 54005]EXM14959.1 hypothetical protein FOTG_16661 [Fusarium oxysporum f. sp. vasinfectum 25433]